MTKTSKKVGKKTGKVDIKGKLARFKKKWDSSKKAASQSQWDYPGPDGPVVGVVKSCEFDDNVWGKGELGVRIKCEVASGRYKGKPLPAITRSLENDDALVWLQRDLTRLGCDIDEIAIDALEETLKDLEGTFFTGKVKTGENGYQNLNIGKVIDEDDVEDSTPDDEEEAEEEEEEEAEEDEDEDEEEDEAHKKGKAAKGKAAKGKKSKDEDEDEEEEEEAEEEEDEDGDDGDEESEEDEDEEEAEEEEEEAVLEVGSKVVWKDGKKEVTGVVKSINEKKGTVEVLPKGSKTKVSLKVSQLELLA